MKENKIQIEPIAVIGLGSWYPGAENPKELWENILARRQQFRQIPDCRLPLSDYFSPDKTTPDKTYGDRAAVIDGYDFDWAGKKITKFAYENTDIVHWLALDTALQAINDAGFEKDTIPTGKTGTFIGNTLTGEITRSNTMRLRWPYVRKVFHTLAKSKGWNNQSIQRWESEMETIYKSVFAPVTEDTLAGGLSNTIAGRICNYLDLDGGGYTVDGACSSSLLAIITAATMLNSKDLDIAIAGGVDISLDTFELIGFAKTNALTAKSMAVYDKAGSGFIPGEGCGVVILKRLCDAIRNGDKIYAVIKGWGISSDGKGGITAPSSDGQSKALIRAYQRAGYGPNTVDFIEGHGTGTIVGDRVELTGIGKAFEYFGNPPVRKCGLTSLKSIIGHTKAASGVGAFIKTVIALNQKILPPTAGCINPHDAFFQPAGKALFPALEGMKKNSHDPMRAGVSAMGFGGINSHVTLESHDEPHDHLKPALPEGALFVSNQETECYVFSAGTREDLILRIKNFKESAQGISMAECADLAFDHNIRTDAAHPFKAGIIADSPKQLLERVDVLLNTLATIQLAEQHVIDSAHQGFWISYQAQAPKIGFLFPGQGSQQVNMMRVLYCRFGWARKLAITFDQRLQHSGYKSILPFVFQRIESAQNPDEIKDWQNTISRTDIAQPAIVLASIIWQAYLKRIGIAPHLVAGHSLGELTAFYVAGAIGLDDLIHLAGLRGKAMAETRETGQMVCLACSDKKVAQLKLLESEVVIANINSPNQTVISGTRTGIANVLTSAIKEGIPTKRLPVSNAFHSKLVAQAAEMIDSKAKLPKTAGDLSIKLFSSITAQRVSKDTVLKNYFSKQVLKPVQFEQLIQTLRNECDYFIEVGPGRVLSGLVKEILPDGPNCLPCEARAGNFTAFNQLLCHLFIHGNNINWEIVYKNRLIKPFIPANKKKFIVNPLEKPLAEPTQNISQNQSLIEALPFLDQIAIPKEQVRQYLDLKGDFIAKIIEEDIKTSLHLFEPIEQTQVDSPMPITDENGCEPEIDVSKDMTSRDIANVLLQIASKRTGFDKDTISLNHKILDDLNLDSIKSAELVAEATKALGIGGKLDASKFANSTLKDVETELQKYISHHQDMTSQDQKKEASEASAWVRNFAVKEVETPIKEDAYNQLIPFINHSICIVHDEKSGHKAIELRNKCKENRINCCATPMNEIDKGILDQSKHIIVLPADITYDVDQFDIAQSIDLLQKISSADFSNWESLTFIHSGREIDPFALSIHLERPHIKIRSLDLPKTISVKDMFEIYAQELSRPEPLIAARYSEDIKRFILAPFVQNPGEYKSRNIKWTAMDVALVTGGAKGITAECIKEWTRNNNVKLAILGRSALPDKNDLTNEINQNLDQLTRQDAIFHYYPCDITDFESVRRTLAKVQNELGDISAIIHGAGANKPRRVEQVSLSGVIQEVSPKIQGIQNIFRSLRNKPIKMIAAFSSIIGVTGMPGNAWYAWANKTLEKLLEEYHRHHENTQIIDLAYSIWDEVGMGARMGSVDQLAQMGISAISRTEGVKRFVQLLEHTPNCQKTVIAARLGGLDTWNPIIPQKPDASRFLEKILVFEPNVELIAQAHVSLEDDLYLQDHNFKGSYLFPTVFGLEAMGQAVAYVTGRQTFEQPLKIEHINLNKPIVVDSKKGLDIQIRAQVEETDQKHTLRVKADITTEQSDFQIEHFSAEFLLNVTIHSKQADISIPDAPLPINPARDIYGKILWQGPRFQRMQEIFFIDSQKTVFSSVGCNDHHNQTLAFSNAKRSCFILGDPFFRDTMLQSVQISIPEDLSLPISIGSMVINQMGSPESANIASEILELKDDIYRTNIVSFTQSGQIKEELFNYRLKIIEKVPPPLGDVTRLQNELDHSIKKYCEIIKLISPDIKLIHQDGLENFTKDQRRHVEQEFIKKAFDKHSDLSWDEAGKPNIRDHHCSFSHKNNLLLCVLDPEPAACDIEEIDERELKTWEAILPHQGNLLEKLTNLLEDPLNHAGTRLWGCDEITKKLGIPDACQTRIIKKYQEAVVFEVSAPDRTFHVLSFPYKAFDNRHYMVHTTVQLSAELHNPIQKELLIEDNIFTYQDKGPQEGNRYTTRFFVTYNEVKSANKKVMFPAYAIWMGKLREIPMEPVSSQLLDLLSTNEWALVTNESEIQILGDLTAFDVVEGSIWVPKIWGKFNSSFDLHYEWKKVLKNGKKVRVGLSKMAVTWAKIIGHGKVEPAEFPGFLTGIMEEMAPRNNNKDNLIGLDEEFKNITLRGNQLDYSNKLNQAPLLTSHTFATSYEDINLIGNIYYANYYSWIKKITDAYFFEKKLKLFLNHDGETRAISKQINIHHLREAMPFDTIKIDLHLLQIYQNGLTLEYHFFRKEDNGFEKIAIGTQEIVLTQKDSRIGGISHFLKKLGFSN